VAQVAQPSAGLGAELSDAALVGLYRDGGGDFAFGELIRRHQIGVFRLLLTILSDPDQAERLCEQTFFDAARKLDELQDPANFYAWVAGLARGLAQKLDDERKKTRVAPKKPRGAPKNPRDAVKRGVQAVLSELANDERVALVLADLEGDSYESIAKTLGTTAVEAEAMVERARQQFIGAFTQHTELEEAPPAVASTKEELALGTLLGKRFRLEAKLGEGGMGMVFRATDLETGRDVAVKTLLPEAAKDAALRKRFELEAELIEKLAHPNFVRFVGHGGGKSEPAYVVMELVNGSALDRLLKAESRLGPKRALHIAEHVLTGLGWAHEQGVVHRDIKPENVVLVTADGDPDFAKILDLGIARLLAPKDEVEKTRLTQKGEIFGTPVYMSPEQVQGEEVDGRSDLYSLTVMLFELIASRPPFLAKNSTALFAMHLATPAPRLSDVAPELRVPSALEALLQRGLAKDPAQRLGSAKDYLSEVRALLSADWDQSEQITAPRSAEPRILARPLAAGAAKAASGAASAPKPRPNPRGLRRIPLGVSLAIIALVIWAVWQGIQMFRD
jgi:DNA-directed RNA polymerase specialized sigma24 family protein